LKIIVAFEEEEEFADDDFPRKDNARERLLFFIKDEDRNVATNFPEEEERPL
jgi:hypothetical protein|tara:strand:- start:377 stop:532 length:156 start_codon:yes stop_codon:yes gene_type:complete